MSYLEILSNIVDCSSANLFNQTLSRDSKVVVTGAVFRLEGDEKYET